MVLVTHSLLKGIDMTFTEIHYRTLYPSLTELCTRQQRKRGGCLCFNSMLHLCSTSSKLIASSPSTMCVCVCVCVCAHVSELKLNACVCLFCKSRSFKRNCCCSHSYLSVYMELQHKYLKQVLTGSLAHLNVYTPMLKPSSDLRFMITHDVETYSNLKCIILYVHQCNKTMTRKSIISMAITLRLHILLAFKDILFTRGYVGFIGKLQRSWSQHLTTLERARQDFSFVSNLYAKLRQDKLYRQLS